MEYLRGANTAKVKTELASYKEQVELFKVEQISKDSNFLDESLTAGKSNLFYNTQKEEEQGNGTIKDIIENISDSYFEKMEIIKGELLINTKDNNEIKIAQSLGINVNPYDIDENGVLLSTGNNLALMDENGTVTIPDNVTEIGAGAFANEGLKTIIIPGTVKKIQANAFAYNSTLETVIMQEGVEEIGDRAFQYCGELKEVYMPESLKDIGEATFYQNKNLREIKIPSNIKTIEYAVFCGCTNLIKVTLNQGLEKIGDRAFSNTGFQEIVLPSTISYIGTDVFTNNTKLDKMDIEGNEPKYIYEQGMLMPKEKNKILFLSDAYLKSITTFNIPEGVENFEISIEKYSNIKKIVIPKSLKSITSKYLIQIFPDSISEVEVVNGNEKYEVSEENKILYTKDTKEIISCFSKEEVIDLKDEENKLGILKLAHFSFSQAENAKKIILPNSLIEICNQVFSQCKKIEEIQIGKNVSIIDPIFKYTNYYGIITIDDENENYVVENKVLYTKTEPKTLVAVLYGITDTFEVDKSVEVIGNRAFHGQRKMKGVIIPEGVKKIENSFNYCDNLVSVEIPDSVESIGGACFSANYNLEKVIIYNKKLLETAPWGAIKGDKVIDFRG